MGLYEMINMKAVSQVVGVVIALALLVPVILGFLSLERSYQKQYFMVMRSYREKLDLIPLVNQSGIYISIVNPGPIEPVIVKYLILKNISNGKILSIRELNKKLDVGDSVDVILFNTTSIRGKIDVIAVTLDGAIFHLDPEFVGNDGVLDQQDIEKIIRSDQGGFYVNPVTGWAFNKSLIIRDSSGKLHYLIPYSVGNKSWAESVSDVVYARESFSYTARWHIYKISGQTDYVLGKIKITVSNDKRVSVYLYASDGTLIKAEENIPLGTTRRDWDLDPSLSGSSSTRSKEYYSIRASGSAGTGSGCLSIETRNSGGKVEVHVYAGTTSYISYSEYARITAKQYEFLFVWRTVNGNVAKILNRGQTVKLMMTDGFISSTICDVSVAPGSSTVVYPRETFDLDVSLLVVVNPSKSYITHLKVPYTSFDVYQPSMSNKVIFATFVRDADWSTDFDYTNYLFPGELNYLEINATVPEMYVLEISQPNNYLPTYWILVSWLDPRLVVNIANGGCDLLVKYGLVKTGAEISFVYSSVVIQVGEYDCYYKGKYNAGDTLTLSSERYIIIPKEGPYKGNVFYLWVDDWEVLKQ